MDGIDGIDGIDDVDTKGFDPGSPAGAVARCKIAALRSVYLCTYSAGPKATSTKQRISNLRPFTSSGRSMYSWAIQFVDSSAGRILAQPVRSSLNGVSSSRRSCFCVHCPLCPVPPASLALSMPDKVHFCQLCMQQRRV
jgi:hypothetical protein